MIERAETDAEIRDAEIRAVGIRDAEIRDAEIRDAEKTPKADAPVKVANGGWRARLQKNKEWQTKMQRVG